MIVGHVGNQGAGKTLGSVMWAYYFSFLTGAPIVTNVEMSIYHLHFFDWHDMVELAPDNSIILFDEIDTAIDSRNFKSTDQIAFTHWFKQLRKRGITFFYNCQRLDMVEMRVRKQTDYVVMCRKNWLWNKLKADWYDTQSGLENAFLVKSFNLDMHQRAYSLYDSFKTIKTTMQ